MPSLHVLAIGGSGARVIRSLTMLFAAGFKLNYFDKVVPILIDADKSNGSLKRTDRLLKEYVSARKHFGSDKYFCTEIAMSKFDKTGEEKFVYYVDQEKTFKEYLNLKSITKEETPKYKEIKMLLELLFSGKTSAGVPLMEVQMNEGFQGNPNIGSLVMSDFAGELLSKLGEQLEAEPAAGHEIIFATSIFGGTGAAGFPAFLTKMRKPVEGEDDILGQAKLSEIPIGAVTLLPYYALAESQGSKDSINSAHFAPKTKSALNYYLGSIYTDLEDITQEKEHLLEAFYYIADEYIGTPQPNEKGGKTGNGQDNAACFGELLAALAILDFAGEAPHLRCNKPATKDKIVFKQFETISNNSSGIKFNTTHLPTELLNMLKEHFSKLFMAKKFLNHMFLDAKDLNFYPWFHKLNVSNSDVQKLIKPPSEAPTEWKFLDDYEKWLTDLASNGRKFSPFALNNKENSDSYDKIVGYLNGFVKKSNETGLKGLLNLLAQISIDDPAMKNILIAEEVA